MEVRQGTRDSLRPLLELLAELMRLVFANGVFVACKNNLINIVSPSHYSKLTSYAPESLRHAYQMEAQQGKSDRRLLELEVPGT